MPPLAFFLPREREMAEYFFSVEEAKYPDTLNGDRNLLQEKYAANISLIQKVIAVDIRCIYTDVLE